jgi:hypothetical protein
MSKKHVPSANDQRSVSKNPTTPAYRDDYQNRIRQGHPVPVAPPRMPAEPKKPAGS